MHGSASVGWLLTAVCLLTASACLLRAGSLRGPARTAAALEAAMGVAMAGMALPGTVQLPPAGYVLVFGLLAGAGVALAAAHGGTHHLHHVVGALAMVYMALAAPAHAGAHAGGGVPVVTAGLLAYFAWYVLRCGAALLPAGTQTAAAGAVRLRNTPDFAVSCRLAMGAGMLAMLVGM